MNPTIENNFKYHNVTPEQARQCTLLRQALQVAALRIEELCPNSREKSLAMTNLEQAMFWANAAIARN